MRYCDDGDWGPKSIRTGENSEGYSLSDEDLKKDVGKIVMQQLLHGMKPVHFRDAV